MPKPPPASPALTVAARLVAERPAPTAAIPATVCNLATPPHGVQGPSRRGIEPPPLPPRPSHLQRRRHTSAQAHATSAAIITPMRGPPAAEIPPSPSANNAVERGDFCIRRISICSDDSDTWPDGTSDDELFLKPPGGLPAR